MLFKVASSKNTTFVDLWDREGGGHWEVQFRNSFQDQEENGLN